MLLQLHLHLHFTSCMQVVLSTQAHTLHVLILHISIVHHKR